MLNKLWQALALFFAGAAAVFAGLYHRNRNAAEQIKHETAEQARELELKAHRAAFDGVRREEQRREEIQRNPVRRVDLE